MCISLLSWINIDLQEVQNFQRQSYCLYQRRPVKVLRVCAWKNCTRIDECVILEKKVACSSTASFPCQTLDDIKEEGHIICNQHKYYSQVHPPYIWGNAVLHHVPGRATPADKPKHITDWNKDLQIDMQAPLRLIQLIICFC